MAAQSRGALTFPNATQLSFDFKSHQEQFVGAALRGRPSAAITVVSNSLKVKLQPKLNDPRVHRGS